MGCYTYEKHYYSYDSKYSGCEASMRKYKLIWHKFRLKCSLISYNDCLDEKMKKKLWHKVEYHEKEIQRIT